MNITGVLVDLLAEMAPRNCKKYMVYGNRKKFLYVEVLSDIYEIPIASLLWYNKFCSDLEIISS